MKYLILILLWNLNSSKTEKEIYQEYYSCWDWEICEFLKLYTDGTFNFKLRSMAGNYIDKGEWLIVRNTLILKSSKRTKPFWKKRKKYFFKNERIDIKDERIEFCNAGKYSMKLKNSNKESLPNVSKDVYKSYAMNDFRVFSTLILNTNGTFEYTEWTHSKQFSKDFGKWNKRDESIVLASNNNKNGFFNSAEFKMNNKEIINQNKKTYKGFYSVLVEEEE